METAILKTIATAKCLTKQVHCNMQLFFCMRICSFARNDDFASVQKYCYCTLKYSLHGYYQYCEILCTVDGFIFVGTKFRELNSNGIFVGIKICGFYIFFHKSYRKSLFCWHWNSWLGPSTKITKIGTQGKLSHPQYTSVMVLTDVSDNNISQY